MNGEIFFLLLVSAHELHHAKNDVNDKSLTNTSALFIYVWMIALLRM